ncbi:MAG: ATP-binding cassette domain-containing protein [Lachnospiraceae bacterium]|nr:ATP-binding cassette domain-containing protein [Lachnospiraceae bacterium]
MIEVKNLVKQFKKPIRGEGIKGMVKTLFSTKHEIKTAVDNISFKIDEGEIVGYIGSNGAGKSTTIKMMCGILNPTSGSVLINGLEPYKKRKQVAQNIGVVFGQKTQLWWDIQLIESYKVLKEIYEISDVEYAERMKFLDDVLGLSEFLNQPVRTLSLGQRMRADLAASLLHNPKVLFLDEPTIGLDVLVKEKIRTAIKEMNKKYNTTVILTTHDMADIENLCSRIIIIDEGHIIYDGDLFHIKNKFGDLRTVTIELRDNLSSTDCFNTFGGNVAYTLNDLELTVNFDALKVNFEEVMNNVLTHIHMKDMKIKEISIEEVVREIYKKEEMEG